MCYHCTPGWLCLPPHPPSRQLQTAIRLPAFSLPFCSLIEPGSSSLCSYTLCSSLDQHSGPPLGSVQYLGGFFCTGELRLVRSAPDVVSPVPNREEDHRPLGLLLLRAWGVTGLCRKSHLPLLSSRRLWPAHSSLFRPLRKAALPSCITTYFSIIHAFAE